MFPGSILSQIKDLNEKLIKTSSLINLSINTANAKRLKRTRGKYEEFSEKYNLDEQIIKRKNNKEVDLFTDTLVIPNDLEMATLNVAADSLQIKEEQGKINLKFSFSFLP